MARSSQTYIDSFLKDFGERHAAEPEFVQSVKEVAGSLGSLLDKHPEYEAAAVLERISEPERLIQFRVAWTDDAGKVQVNRGYRVQFSSLLGPYKGGLRFHPSVNRSVLQFLGFEQIFKNSLTGLWLGGAKGGADFDPKGKSDAEVMRFCQAFITELANYIGPDTDVPAGDIGVGSREIGYMFGQYKKLAGEFHGSLTGKGVDWGGSNLRPEATGYGLVYFVEAMLQERDDSLDGKTVAISGAGNVAQYAAQKALQQGSTVLTMSDSDGTIYDADGIDNEKLQYIMKLKNVERGRIREYADKYETAEFLEGQAPWGVEAEVYLPCATQNELDEAGAKQLAAYKPLIVAEGANMPTTPEALQVIHAAGIAFGPGKASNAGGVAVSGLEMAQNSSRVQWSHEDVDEKLQTIMQDIHAKCVRYGRDEKGAVDYVRGANAAGFQRVAQAMLSQGVV